MTRRQIAFVIVVNAAISALITLGAVLWLVLPVLQERGTLLPAAASPSPATDEATVGSEPAAEPVVHVVVAGDTISGLAFQYDVPEADIIAANVLENPNYLRVGMELIIPVNGIPEVTATPTPKPTVTDTPLPFEPPSADMTATAAAESGATATAPPTPLPVEGELEIEITEVIRPGEIGEESVVVTNVGERLADMAGWILRDEDGNRYVFPNYRLWGAGAVTVHSKAGQDGFPPSNFYWGQKEAVWSPGETVTLETAEGVVMATYTVAR